MYENVLIPTDGTTEAELGERHGVDLAAAIGATVHGLYVVEEGGNPWMSQSMDEQLDLSEGYGQQILDRLGGLAADAGVTYESDIKVGPSVHERINEYVEEAGIDVIVMGVGYHGRFGGLLGSTTDRVLRSANVPVLTVRQPAEA